MSNKRAVIFGIDLGTTYSCISYVDRDGQAIVIPNKTLKSATPSIVLFDGENRIVGDEAKNSTLLKPDNTGEMVKHHMGEANWRFFYKEEEITPEEISAYILRKLAMDAENVLHIPVRDVVITCPAYFGIAQREATARAGEIAGFNVHEIINEPTAAAITYGLQDMQDQVVLVYDLGGGTFDVTVIRIQEGAITVLATGGDHHLGGRNWDEAIIVYLADKWQKETGSEEDPLDSANTLQSLWLEAEKAKWALTTQHSTSVTISHIDQQVEVSLTRDTFEKITANLLDRTILYTKMAMKEARKRGYHQFDQILLVGGSTRMPQIARRLEQEFHLPLRLFEPDEAVAKGAALYGQKLLIDEHISTRVAKLTNLPPTVFQLSEIDPDIVQLAQRDVARTLGLKVGIVRQLAKTSIVNVTSHSFGIIAIVDYNTPRCREVIENLLIVNDPLPAFRIQTFGTLDTNQETVELRVAENTEETLLVEPTHYTADAEIGKVILPLPPGLPAHSPVEVTFELDRQGRLCAVGREPISNTTVEAILKTKGSLSKEEVQCAKARVAKITIT